MLKERHDEGKTWWRNDMMKEWHDEVKTWWRKDMMKERHDEGKTWRRKDMTKERHDEGKTWWRKDMMKERHDEGKTSRTGPTAAVRLDVYHRPVHAMACTSLLPLRMPYRLHVWLTAAVASDGDSEVVFPRLHDSKVPDLIIPLVHAVMHHLLSCKRGKALTDLKQGALTKLQIDASTIGLMIVWRNVLLVLNI